jgi:hypothetical protein
MMYIPNLYFYFILVLYKSELEQRMMDIDASG